MFVRRRINLSFTLGNGSFAGNLNTLTVSDLRVRAKIAKAGGNSFGQLQMVVFGLSLSQMNQMSTLGQKVQTVNKDSVTVLAGDDRNGMSVVFKGNIFNAYADLNSAPQGGFIISAQTEYANAVAPAPALSFGGGVDVATVMQSIAQQMGLKFENNGVSVILSNPYFSGSVVSQLQRAAKAANILYTVDAGILAIWPKNGSRQTSADAIPLVSSTSGLDGYPSYTAGGIKVKSIYNPAIQFGKKIKVESDQKPANGVWTVYAMDYDLDSNQPAGSWHMTLDCYNPDFGLTIKR